MPREGALVAVRLALRLCEDDLCGRPMPIPFFPGPHREDQPMERRRQSAAPTPKLAAPKEKPEDGDPGAAKTSSLPETPISGHSGTGRRSPILFPQTEPGLTAGQNGQSAGPGQARLAHLHESL